MSTPKEPATRPIWQLRFQSLVRHGRALVFPCDARGHVDLDALSEKARCEYFYARACVGRDYAVPAIVRGC